MTKLQKRLAAGMALLTFSAFSLADGWDVSAIVTSITGVTQIIISIGGAILGVVALTFGFRMVKSMLKSG